MVVDNNNNNNILKFPFFFFSFMAAQQCLLWLKIIIIIIIIIIMINYWSFLFSSLVSWPHNNVYFDSKSRLSPMSFLGQVVNDFES